MSLAYITTHARMHEAGSSNPFCLLACQSVSHYRDQGIYQWCTPPSVCRFMEIHPWACGPEGISLL